MTYKYLRRRRLPMDSGISPDILLPPKPLRIVQENHKSKCKYLWRDHPLETQRRCCHGCPNTPCASEHGKVDGCLQYSMGLYISNPYKGGFHIHCRKKWFKKTYKYANIERFPISGGSTPERLFFGSISLVTLPSSRHLSPSQSQQGLLVSHPSFRVH